MNSLAENTKKLRIRELFDQSYLSEVIDDLTEKLSPVLDKFGYDVLERIAGLGDRVARHSHKTAVCTLQKSPDLIDRVGYDGLEKIAGQGIKVAQHCWRTAVGMLENSPGLIDRLLQYGDRNLVMDVFDLSGQVARYSWKASVSMLEKSPDLIDRVGFVGLEKVAGLGIRIARYDWLTAVSNFQKSPDLIDRLLKYGDLSLVMNVLDLANRVSRYSWQTAVRLLDVSPYLIEKAGYDGLIAITAFASKVSRYNWKIADSILEKSPGLIDRLLEYGNQNMVGDVYGLSNQTAQHCWRTAVHLLEKSPDLIDRTGYDGLVKIATRASELTRSNYERAISFINGESSEGSLFMDTITETLELKKIRPVLANYLNALLGYRIEVAEASEHSTDGARIYLPEKVNDFEERSKNFTLYKVLATHEEAHLEYGSFDFDLLRIGDVVDKIRSKYGEA
jgi:hypothetical protein